MIVQLVGKYSDPPYYILDNYRQISVSHDVCIAFHKFNVYLVYKNTKEYLNIITDCVMRTWYPVGDIYTETIANIVLDGDDI